MSLKQAYRGGHPISNRPGWFLAFEGDDFEQNIEAMKAIDARRRSYDPVTHLWWIDEAIAEDVARLIVPGLEAHLRQGSLL